MAGEIEFLDAEPAPGDDEQLRTAGRHRPARVGRTARLAAGVGLAALIVGALVVRGATSGHDTPAAAPSRSAPATVGTSASPSSSTTVLDPSTGDPVNAARRLCTSSDVAVRAFPVPITRSSRAARPSTIPVQNDPGPGSTAGEHIGDTDCVSAAAAVCPRGPDGLSACTTVPGLPAAVRSALRDQYPGSQVTSSFTEVARETGLIWYRSVMVAINPDVTLEITLKQAGNDPGESGTRNYGPLIQQVRAVQTGEHLNTIVEYTGRFGRRTSLSMLSRLAADSRLASVG